MAYNDMEVIAYKILSYLYECMKYGATPRPEDLEASSSMLRIPERYRQQVVEALLNEGLVTGFWFHRGSKMAYSITKGEDFSKT